MTGAIFLVVLQICLFVDHNIAQNVTMTKYECEDSFMTLSCPDTQVLQIERALYGRFSTAICRNDFMSNNLRCQSTTAQNVVSLNCEGRQKCEFHVSNAIFGDPCVGTSKYAEVAYKCKQVEFTQYECEGGVLNLSCPQNHVISVIWAFYGRTSSLICINQFSNNNLQCQATATTQIVSKRCNGLRECQLPVNNSILQDFCVGTSKYAKVQYTCQRS